MIFRFRDIKGFYAPIFAQCASAFSSEFSPDTSLSAKMKSYLLVCLVAAAIMATQGYRHKHMQESYKFQDEALSTLDNLQDPASGAPPVGIEEAKRPPNPHDDCDCVGVCHKLHDDRLPKEIQVSTKQNEIITLATKRFKVCRTSLKAFRKPSEDIMLNWYFYVFFLGRAQISKLREFSSVVSWCSLYLSATRPRRKTPEKIYLQANVRLLPLLQWDVLQMPE